MKPTYFIKWKKYLYLSQLQNGNIPNNPNQFWSAIQLNIDVVDQYNQNLNTSCDLTKESSSIHDGNKYSTGGDKQKKTNCVFVN